MGAIRGARTVRARTVAAVAALVLLSGLWAAMPRARGAEAAGVTITQARLGNVFLAGEEPAIGVRTTAGEVWWSATRTGDEPDACERFTLPGGAGTAEIPLRLASPGTYEVRVGTTARCNPSAADSTTVALLPRPAGRVDDGFTYSVQARFSKNWETGIIPLMTRAGVESVRDAQRWNAIEKVDPQTGESTYVFAGTKFQRYMDELREAGLDAHLGLGLWHRAHTGTCAPRTKAQREAFARFARAVADNYGDQVAGIGVYNEPNGKVNDGACAGQAEPRNHAALTGEVYDAVKDTPSAPAVTAPELAAGTPNTPEVFDGWLAPYLRASDLGKLDVAAVHPYRPKNDPDGGPTPEGPEPEGLVEEQIEPVRELLRREGVDKPIWISEMGWQSHTLDEKERDQARYLTRAHVLAMSAGVTRFSWYAFMDTTVPARTFGLITNDTGDPDDRYRPKPAYAAYAVMTAQLSGLTHDSREPGLGKAAHSHLFSGGEEELRVMWRESGTQVAELTTREPVRVTDLMGRVTTLRPGADGLVRLPLTENPQYVSGDVLTLRAG